MDFEAAFSQYILPVLLSTVTVYSSNVTGQYYYDLEQKPECLH